MWDLRDNCQSLVRGQRHIFNTATSNTTILMVRPSYMLTSSPLQMEMEPTLVNLLPLWRDWSATPGTISTVWAGSCIGWWILAIFDAGVRWTSEIEKLWWKVDPFEYMILQLSRLWSWQHYTMMLIQLCHLSYLVWVWLCSVVPIFNAKKLCGFTAQISFLGQLEVGMLPICFGITIWPLSRPDMGDTAPFFAIFVGVVRWKSERYLEIGLIGRIIFGDEWWWQNTG